MILRGLPPAGATAIRGVDSGACPPEPGILILGSFPSVASLEKGEYYGNARNHFWTLVSGALGCAEPAAYPDRIDMLAAAGIVVWDVIDHCERKGSLDRDIRGAEPNPVLEFLAARPSIAKIGLNGGLAFATFMKVFSVTAECQSAPASTSDPSSSEKVPGQGGKDGCAGTHFVWKPGILGGRGILVMRLPSSSPVPSASFRSSADKQALWTTFLRS